MSLPRLYDKIIDAVVVNNAVSNSEAVELYFTTGYSVQALWTGAATTGSIKLQMSINGDDWEDVGSSSQAISGPGSFIWNVTDVHYRYVRVVVEETASNDLTVNAWIYSKGL